MARQVAHEIKNPLTPNPAVGRARAAREHRSRPPAVSRAGRLRRGDPHAGEAAASDLDRVLELCIVAHARPEPTALPALIEEVVEPYRTGLANRIVIEVQADPSLPTVTIDRTLFARR